MSKPGLAPTCDRLKEHKFEPSTSRTLDKGKKRKTEVVAASSDAANSKKPAKTDKQVQAAAAAAAAVVVANFGEHTSLAAKQSVPQKAGKKDQGAAHGEKMPKDNQLDDDEFNSNQEPAPRAAWQAEVTVTRHNLLSFSGKQLKGMPSFLMKSKEDLVPCLDVALDAYNSAKAELTSAQQKILDYEEHARSVNAAWHKGMADFKATMTAATQEGPRPYMDNYVKAASSVVESAAKVANQLMDQQLSSQQLKTLVECRDVRNQECMAAQSRFVAVHDAYTTADKASSCLTGATVESLRHAASHSKHYVGQEVQQPLEHEATPQYGQETDSHSEPTHVAVQQTGVLGHLQHAASNVQHALFRGRTTAVTTAAAAAAAAAAAGHASEEQNVGQTIERASV